MLKTEGQRKREGDRAISWFHAVGRRWHPMGDRSVFPWWNASCYCSKMLHDLKAINQRSKMAEQENISCVRNETIWIYIYLTIWPGMSNREQGGYDSDTKASVTEKCTHVIPDWRSEVWIWQHLQPQHFSAYIRHGPSRRENFQCESIMPTEEWASALVSFRHSFALEARQLLYLCKKANPIHYNAFIYRDRSLKLQRSST